MPDLQLKQKLKIGTLIGVAIAVIGVLFFSYGFIIIKISQDSSSDLRGSVNMDLTSNPDDEKISPPKKFLRITRTK